MSALQQVISDLGLTEKLRKIFQTPRSRWEHPLALLVIGFFFTGVLGTLLSFTVQTQQAKRERARQILDAQHAEDTQHYQSSTRAVVDFSDSLYLRYVRAGMLKSALARGASSKEIRYRKEQYDEALVRQESTALSSHLLIREALKEQDYDDWETGYQYALKPRLNLLDKDLTIASDAYLKGSKKTSKLIQAKLKDASKVYTEVRVCNSALVNAIFRSLSSKQYLSGTKVIDTQQKAKADLNEQCPTQTPF